MHRHCYQHIPTPTAAPTSIPTLIEPQTTQLMHSHMQSSRTSGWGEGGVYEWKEAEISGDCAEWETERARIIELPHHKHFLRILLLPQQTRSNYCCYLQPRALRRQLNTSNAFWIQVEKTNHVVILSDRRMHSAVHSLLT